MVGVDINTMKTTILFNLRFLTRFVKFQDYNFWFPCLCAYSCCSRKIGRNEKLKPKVVFIVFIYTTKIVYQRGVPQLRF